MFSNESEVNFNPDDLEDDDELKGKPGPAASFLEDSVAEMFSEGLKFDP